MAHGYKPLADWQMRVIEEQQEIEAKISKLNQFIQSPRFDGVIPHEQELLRQQHSYMTGYHRILRERIGAWPLEKADD